MDLDNVLKIEENQFPIETDSDLHSKFMPYFKIQEDWHSSQNEDVRPSIDDAILELQKCSEIVDEPIDQLISLLSERYEEFSFQHGQMFRKLKKTKIILKRHRAKNRSTQPCSVRLEPSPTQEHRSSTLPFSDDELKRKKNRISAQISRDRKKEFFNNLIRENETLKQDKYSLQKQNSELKHILNGKIFNGFKIIIQRLDLKTITQLLEQVKKPNLNKKHKRNSKLKNAIESILHQSQNHPLN